jgi:hypothetical protein
MHDGQNISRTAHPTDFGVGLAQLNPAIRTLLAGSFRAGNAVSIRQISDFNDFAAGHLSTLNDGSL